MVHWLFVKLICFRIRLYILIVILMGDYFMQVENVFMDIHSRLAYFLVNINEQC